MPLAAAGAKAHKHESMDAYQGRGVNGSKTHLPPAVLTRVPGTKTARHWQATKWTSEQDAALAEAVRKYGKAWTRVAADVALRTNEQCCQRWNKTLRPGLVRGVWSPNEDDKLAQALAEITGEPVNWKSVASRVAGRNAKQCKARFQRKLDSALRRDEWTAEEDTQLLASYETCNGRWAIIAKTLPGRREDSVKTRFHSLQRQASELRPWSVDEDVALVQQYLNTASAGKDVGLLAKRSERAKTRRFRELEDKHSLVEHAFEREAALTQHEIKRLLLIGEPVALSTTAVSTLWEFQSDVAPAKSPGSFSLFGGSQHKLANSHSLGSITSAAEADDVTVNSCFGASLSAALADGKKLRETAPVRDVEQRPRRFVVARAIGISNALEPG